MNPELLHLVPEMLEWLYRNQPVYFHSLVTAPIAFFVVIMPFAFIAALIKERRQDQRTREIWGQVIKTPALPFRKRFIGWAALIILILVYAVAVAYLLWAVGLLKI